MNHLKKLFDQHGDIVSVRPVVAEFYDEIVFQDPSEKLLRLLRRTPQGDGLKLRESSLSPYCKLFFLFKKYAFVVRSFKILASRHNFFLLVCFDD